MDKVSTSASKARANLLKRIEGGYRPLAKTLEKYNITGVEAKPQPEPRTRDPEAMKRYKHDTYERHRFDYCRKNVIYKVAHGHRVKRSTLEKYDLPHDIHPFHPLVRKRQEYTGPCSLSHNVASS